MTDTKRKTRRRRASAIALWVLAALVSGCATEHLRQRLYSLPAGVQTVAAVDLGRTLADADRAELQELLLIGELTEGVTFSRGELDLRDIERVEVVASSDAAAVVAQGQELDAPSVAATLSDALGLSETARVHGILVRRAADRAIGVLDEHTLVVGTPRLVESVIGSARGAVETVALDEHLAPLLQRLGPDGDVLLATTVPGDPEVEAVALTLRVEAVRTILDAYVRPDAIGAEMIDAGIDSARAALMRSVTLEFVLPAYRAAWEPWESRSLLDLVLSGLDASFRPSHGGFVSRTRVADAQAGRLAVLATAHLALGALVPARDPWRSTAQEWLEGLVSNIRRHFEEPRTDPTGARLPCELPESFGCIPSTSPCDYPDHLYPPTLDDWRKATFAALRTFYVFGPHPFRYCYSRTGSGRSAEFTLSAHTDLDCDGVWSTYQMIGFAALDSTSGDCRLVPTIPMVVDQPGE